MGWLIGAWACQSGAEPPGEVTEGDEEWRMREAVEDTTPLDHPPMPRLALGRLRLRTSSHAEPFRLDHDWPAVAYRCENPTVVQIVGLDDESGGVILLGPPSPGTTGSFTIERGTDELPDTAHARLGVQAQPPEGDEVVLRGTGGTVMVSEVDDVTAAQLRGWAQEESFRDTVAVVAAYRGVIEPAPEGWCRVNSRRERPTRRP